MSCSIFSRSIGTYLMVGIFINRRVNDYIGNVVLLNSFYALFDIKLIYPVYLYNSLTSFNFGVLHKNER